ncbi:MAG: PilZ domain-containing protein [Pseudobdellovibrionaceae bacterium]
MGPKIQQKRKFPRRKFPRKVGVLVNGDYFVADGVEVGEGGISVSTAQGPMKERPVVLSFQIPGGSFVSVRAELKNERTQDGQYILGFSFENLKFDKKREVRTFVSSRSSSEELRH